MFRSMITRLVLVGLTAAIVGLPEVALGLPRATSEWVVEGHERNASFGTSVASAGDVNGDGYDDVVVGAPLYGPGDPGAAFLFLGSATGPSTAPDWAVWPHQAYASFGTSVASAGDVNGDGYDDVVIGAPFYGPDDGERPSCSCVLPPASRPPPTGPPLAIRRTGSSAPRWLLPET